MGQALAKLNQKYLTGEDQSSSNESKGMLHDASATDENDINLSNQQNDETVEENSDVTTPKQNELLRLKCDPRSPSSFDRTPLKLTSDKTPAGGDSF